MWRRYWIYHSRIRTQFQLYEGNVLFRRRRAKIFGFWSWNLCHVNRMCVWFSFKFNQIDWLDREMDESYYFYDEQIYFVCILNAFFSEFVCTPQVNEQFSVSEKSIYIGEYSSQSWTWATSIDHLFNLHLLIRSEWFSIFQYCLHWNLCREIWISVYETRDVEHFHFIIITISIIVWICLCFIISLIQLMIILWS